MMGIRERRDSNTDVAGGTTVAERRSVKNPLGMLPDRLLTS